VVVEQAAELAGLAVREAQVAVQVVEEAVAQAPVAVVRAVVRVVVRVVVRAAVRAAAWVPVLAEVQAAALVAWERAAAE
jgi:hypothetical protein